MTDYLLPYLSVKTPIGTTKSPTTMYGIVIKSPDCYSVKLCLSCMKSVPIDIIVKFMANVRRQSVAISQKPRSNFKRSENWNVSCISGDSSSYTF